MSLKWNALDEIEHILRQAHLRMDRLGYPPAQRHTDPIDGRTNKDNEAA